MMRVAGSAEAGELEGSLSAAAAGVFIRFEDQDSRPFPKIQTRPVAVERGTRLGTRDAERPEPGDGHAIKLIRAAGNDDVAKARVDPVFAHPQRIRTR